MEFEEWLRARLPSMLRLSTALCGSPQPAEDLVQDVIIKAHAQWDRIQLLDQPDAYLRRMVINEHLSWRRRVAAAVRRDTSTEWGDVDQRRPFDQQWVDRDELVTQIRRLTPRQRAVIVLRYLDDLTIAETAHALGCTQSTVRAHTARALASLRITLPVGQTGTTTAERPMPSYPAKDRHAH
ncbi:MAG: SigE family RNA polymerase sigma factor [Janthinobacterium lividum]